MANFSGFNATSSLEEEALRPGAVAANMVPPAIPVSVTGVDDTIMHSEAGPTVVGTPVSPAPVNNSGFCANGVGRDWADKIHIIPRRIDYGNIVGTIINTVDIFSSFQTQDVSFTDFINNAGAGLDITDLPALPVTIEPFGGLSLTLEVTTNGVPQFDTTLDFVFDVGTTQLPVTGTRLVVFVYRPETPMKEVIGFLTDIFEHIDGSEQRVSLRKNPRQTYELNLLREEGTERSRIDMLLFDRQADIFGLPMWHEPMILTSPAAVNDLTINVDSTDFTDLKVGGVVLILDPDEVTFDAIEVASFTATTITLSSAIQNIHPEGTDTFVVKPAILDQTFRGSRFPVGAGTFNIRFRIIDNDVDIADTSSFNTFAGKVLLNDKNFIDSQMSESYERRMVEYDNRTGRFGHASTWTRNRRTSSKTFKTNSRQEAWQVRQLLHALRGRQVSWWLPTFYKEFVVVADLVNATQTMNVTNVGYSQFVRNRAPKNVINLIKTDGTSLERTITASSIVDKNTEVLTVDVAWPSNITVAEIDRVEIYELVRLDSDNLTVEHQNSIGQAAVSFPVKVVFE